MYVNQSLKKFYSEDAEIKKKIRFSNVFSKMKKGEKNKQYTNLQSNLNNLSRDVRLLVDFASKDSSGKVKDRNLTKGYQYKKFIDRSNFLLAKKKNKRFTSILNIINNYIDSHQKHLDQKAMKEAKYNKKKVKELNKSKEHYSIYKTEVTRSSNINGQNLPTINFNSERSSFSLEKNPINLDIGNTSPKLPLINRKSRQLHLFTENDTLNQQKENKLIIPIQEYNKHVIPKNKSININSNSFLKKFPDILNNQRINSGINRYELSKSADKIAKLMQDKNIKIKNRINYKLAEQDLVDWEMKSKLKLARWKFGIAEIEKYFVDLNTYGKPEEEELLKRKTFYDIVEELIDEIKQVEEEKDIKKIKDKYNKEEKKDFEFDKNGKKDEQKNELNMVDNAMNKHSEISQVLKKIKLRRINEERTRHLIDDLLIQSDLRRKAINRSTDKLYSFKNKKERLNEINNKFNKVEKQIDGENGENNIAILVNKEKEEKEDDLNDNI